MSRATLNFLWILSAISVFFPIRSLSFSYRRSGSEHAILNRRLPVCAVGRQRREEPSRIEEEIQFQLHSSISDIPSDKWDKCLVDDPDASPFMQHSWLRCLEESKCVSKETGWMPQHVSISVDGENYSGFVPLYVKSHSMGEFIFDSTWADAALANGIEYYPKLLVAVPFTPASGRKILLHPKIRKKFRRERISSLRKMLTAFLKQIARNNKLSSVHINFLTEEEAEDIAEEAQPVQVESSQDPGIQQTFRAFMNKLKQSDLDEGYIRRTSLQYHWSNSNSMNQEKPYTNFEEYLSRFKSKRRISIRRERARVQEDEGIRIDAVVGKDILECDGLVERMFQIYLSTVDKMFWGRQYLTLEFFHLLAKSDFLDNLCFMCARRKSSGEILKAADVIAGTFNIVKNGVFYGRYWGCTEEVKNLHFETCYWAAIEYCIDNGLRRMEPGAGGGGKQNSWKVDNDWVFC
jgi:predicted N-acyltransferase